MDSALKADRIRKKILLYSLVFLTLICIVIALFCIHPLYSRLKSNAWSEVSHIHSLKEIATEQYLSRLADIARQIASRTRIRQELTKYNSGSISLSQLSEFSSPKLRDAMRLSPEIKGLVRLDKSGSPVVQLGESIPKINWIGQRFDNDKLLYGVPIPLGNAKRILISAPILDRNGERVGLDFVLFTLENLQQITSNATAGYETLLFVKQNGQLESLFPQLTKNEIPIVNTQGLSNHIKLSQEKKADLFRLDNTTGNYDIVSLGNIPTTDWTLVVRVAEKDLYSDINMKLLLVFCLILILILAGVSFLYLILKPLTGKIVLHSEELSAEIEKQTAIVHQKSSLINNILQAAFNLGIVATDKNFYIQYCNQTAGDLFRITPEQIIGRLVEELNIFPASDIVEAAIETVKQGEIYRNTTEQLHSQGIRYIDTQVSGLLVNGRLDGYVLMFRDKTQKITAYREREKNLLSTQLLLDLHKKSYSFEGRALYRYALDMAVKVTGSKVGYVHQVENTESDTTIVLTEWNKEALQKCTALYDTHYPLKKAGIWADSIRQKKPVVHNDYQNHPGKKGHPEGHYVITRHMSVPVLDEGEVKLVLGVGNKDSEYEQSDISQIQLIVNELQSIIVERRILAEQAQLEKRLKESQKMEAIGLLAGGVAHDLNNILSGVVGYPELILQDMQENDRFRKQIQAIQHSGQRATAIVEDLLTVARGVATAKSIHDLNEMVKEYLESPECLKLKSLYPNIICHLRDTAQKAEILCSPIHIKKCLMNLVTNAIEAIPENGNVEISIREQRVNGELAKELNLTAGEYVILGVKDDGPGIAESDLSHIFEPFYTRKEMGRSGTGLGLTIVWNTVEEHDGKIRVQSDDKGTSFQLYFPVSESIQDNSDIPDEKSENIFGNQEQILIVDDEPQLRDLASTMLTNLGYRVDSVCSGELALKFIEENPVDLVVLDMKMEPGMNGLQTYKKIKNLYQGQKAIIASGFSESDNVKAAIEHGASGLIQKPYLMKQLGQAVKRALHL